MNTNPFSKKYRFLCSYCNYLVETEGPWPYCREGKQRRPYENVREACSGPVQGLMGRIYCPNCDKNKEYPVVEYEKPLANLDEIWWTSIPRKTKLTCHRCKKPVYLILPPGVVKCPRCRKGTFDLYEPLADKKAESFPVPPPSSPLKVRQDGKQVRVPKPTIVIDSQEHMGYTFERFTNWFSGSIRKRLAVGDYTILGMEEEVAIERKTVPDLVKSIIQERKDFIEKCERLSEIRKKCLVVEGSLSLVKTPYDETQSHPNAVLGSLLAAQERWNIPVYFLDNFVLAEEFVASMLSKYHAYRWLEINGFQRCLIEGDV
jgi:DNA excision repair protein ERCC-4